MMLGQLSPATHVPMWILYSAPTVGFSLTAIRQVQVIWSRVRSLSKGDA